MWPRPPRAPRRGGARPRRAGRRLDPNLLGAIDRARYAIDVSRRERNATPVSDWWGRTRVNVQNLFRGVMPT